MLTLFPKKKVIISIIFVPLILILVNIDYPIDYRFYFDDFYYYLVIAERFLKGDGLTFFGDYHTNGFHPLWFIIILSLRYLNPNDTIFFNILFIIQIFLQISIIYISFSISKALQGSDFTSSVSAALASSLSIMIGMSGMEVVLTIPLLLGLVWWIIEKPVASQNTPELAITFLLGNLLFLSRLDSAILILLLFLPHVHILIKSPLRLFMFLSLSSPSIAYLLLNLTQFGGLTPISGAAKQLSSTWFGDTLPFLHFSVMLLWFAPAGIAAILIPLRLLDRSIKRTELLYILGIIAFYFVHFSLSDWQLWPWYLYPLVTTLCVSLPLMLRKLDRKIAISASTAALLLVGGRMVLSDYEPSAVITTVAQEVSDFTQMNPGIYSMGDMAGTAAFLSDSEILQTEGLVMDRPYLELIREGGELKDALSQYDVDYHITVHAELIDGCYFVEEPAKGGITSPKLRSKFCGDEIVSTPETSTQYVHIFRIK